MSEPTLELFRARELAFEPGYRGQSSFHDDAQAPLLLLLAITGTVLLIACANIADLLLARGAKRAQEIAIRGSFGASRMQLLRQLLLESCLLAALGGAASLLVARWTLAVIGSSLPGGAGDFLTLELSPNVVLFAAAMSLATGIVFGLYPALHSTRSDLSAVLRANAGQPAGARDAARFRSTLVVARALHGSARCRGLFLKSLGERKPRRSRAADRQHRGLQRRPELNGYKPAESQLFFERAREELAALPGVAAVAGGMVPILSGNSWGNSVSVEGFENGPDVDNGSRYNEIGPGYFSTLEIPLMAGREFTAADVLDAPKVAVVNEKFLDKFGLDGPRAVGKRMATRTGGDVELDIEIVGVMQNSKYNEVKGEVPSLFFLPYRQDDELGSLTFYIRTAGDNEPTMRAIPAVIKRLDANLPIEDVRTLENVVDENVFLDRFISTLASAFALLATLLASVGLYGVLAYTVSQRTREFGVRMALGADAGRVRTMVLGQLGKMTAIGGVIGVVAALGLGRAVQSLLFEIQGHDPLVVTLSVIVLAVVALAAGYIPARRASRIDPMEALRFE